MNRKIDNLWVAVAPIYSINDTRALLYAVTQLSTLLVLI